MIGVSKNIETISHRLIYIPALGLKNIERGYFLITPDWSGAKLAKVTFIMRSEHTILLCAPGFMI